jgi:hypothetical protein
MHLISITWSILKCGHICVNIATTYDKITTGLCLKQLFYLERRLPIGKTCKPLSSRWRQIVTLTDHFALNNRHSLLSVTVLPNITDVFFTILWPCIVTDSLWIKPTDVLNSNFIGITTLHVSGSFSAHHQEFLAIHRLWYILCSCDDRLLTGVGWNCMFAVPSYSW